MTTPYETKRKTKVVYGRVVFQKRTGDLTLSKPGISFTSTDDQGADGTSRPPLVHRVRWNSIHKHFVNKSKPMIKITTVEKDGTEQGLLFKLSNRDELDAFKEDLIARLAPPHERTSMTAVAMAPAIVVPEEDEKEDPAYMNTYVMTKSVNTSKTGSTAPPSSAFPSSLSGGFTPAADVVPFPPTVEIEEDEPVISMNGPVPPPVPVVRAKQQQKQQQRKSKNNPSDMTICTTTTAAYDDMVNTNGDIFGTSRYLSPATGAQLVAEAEFEDFAPCSCVCYKCLVNEKLQKRTYIRVYENRLESNIPYNPWFCLSDERCMVDAPRIMFFDKAPHRVGMYCHLIPCVCCGPPVIYNKVPKACCGTIDLRSCFGEQLFHSQCDCFGLRACLCCGPQCFQLWACPLFMAPIRNGEELLAKWKGALEAFAEKHDIDEGQRAVFLQVEDRCCDSDSGKPIKAIRMER